MDKKSIIKSVKRQEEEKVAFSLKLPASLKEELQTISERESVSMNALIVAVMQSFIDDECGSQVRHLKDLLNSAKGYVNFDAEEEYSRACDPEDYQALSDRSKLLSSINAELTKG